MSSNKKSSSSSSRKSRSTPDSTYVSSYGTTYSSMSPFWAIGTLFGASSVALGAFGAHGLKQRISDPARITNWGTAAQYQLIHSAVLTFTSVVAPQNKLAMGLFTAGMTMFSGSIYLLVLDPKKFKSLGPVTPIGGLCLIGGWIMLAARGRMVVPRVR
ncbi:hypothetical protein P3342_003566 [Pyrenophora teres f. teres]|uniref:DUF423-domain-containing protein n=3 Tax=Pyrenophora TaxID=5027 RepID=E3RX38_PYRTT|nr:hypothetical protein PTT_13921 [Pyrenophora teres f. teres 0-1]KAK1915753.1 hypothetical protein P3342_003566 [Pyrenophora teres f. teres]CAE7012170.1 membrane protein [Pyrenophora teres f. teres]